MLRSTNARRHLVDSTIASYVELLGIRRTGRRRGGRHRRCCGWPEPWPTAQLGLGGEQRTASDVSRLTTGLDVPVTAAITVYQQTSEEAYAIPVVVSARTSYSLHNVA